jgi:uncharacterized membrane protein
MVHFKAITFKGKRTAAKALATIDEQSSYRWIDDIAVISVGKLGFARVDSSWAQSDTAVGAELGWGALTGAMIGALFGPQGALAGALGGGSIGGVIGASFDIAVSDPRLEEFANRMKKDTSALVLVNDGPYASEFSTAFEPFNGELIETELDVKDVETIRKALRK